MKVQAICEVHYGGRNIVTGDVGEDGDLIVRRRSDVLRPGEIADLPDDVAAELLAAGAVAVPQTGYVVPELAAAAERAAEQARAKAEAELRARVRTATIV